jgi:hypothetical protein
MWRRIVNIWGLGRGWPPWMHPYGLQHDTRANSPKDSGAAPWQILDVHLFRRFLLIQMEFYCRTGAIGSSINSLSIHIKRPKWTLYATWASFLARAARGLQGGFELELFWTSTLTNRTELVLGLILYLNTLAGLFFHAMRQSFHIYGCYVLINNIPLVLLFLIFCKLLHGIRNWEHYGSWFSLHWSFIALNLLLSMCLFMSR